MPIMTLLSSKSTKIVKSFSQNLHGSLIFHRSLASPSSSILPKPLPPSCFLSSPIPAAVRFFTRKSDLLSMSEAAKATSLTMRMAGQHFRTPLMSSAASRVGNVPSFTACSGQRSFYHNKTQFKKCRQAMANVWDKNLTNVQRRVLRRVRTQQRSIQKRVYSRMNLNNYIQLQATRKLSFFYGLPISKMKARSGTSCAPFLLDLERRLDVILVRSHFCKTLSQARQLISHGKVCVNQTVYKISHFKVSPGDIVSLKDNDAKSLGASVRRFFYIDFLVSKMIGRFLNRPVRLWKVTKKEWISLLKTKRGCRQILKSHILQNLRSSMKDDEVDNKRKLFGLGKVCLGSSFSEHERMKRNLYHFKSMFLSQGKMDQKPQRSSAIYNSSSYRDSISNLGRPLEAKGRQFRRQTKGMAMPTHYLEVNYKTLKAVVFYGPKIDHIPHKIRSKDLNLLL